LAIRVAWLIHANIRYRLPIDPLLAVIGAGFLPLLLGYFGRRSLPVSRSEQ